MHRGILEDVHFHNILKGYVTGCQLLYFPPVFKEQQEKRRRLMCMTRNETGTQNTQIRVENERKGFFSGANWDLRCNAHFLAECLCDRDGLWPPKQQRRKMLDSTVCSHKKRMHTGHKCLSSCVCVHVFYASVFCFVFFSIEAIITDYAYTRVCLPQCAPFLVAGGMFIIGPI